MTVFILHRDVKYEFGCVLSVWSTRDLAQKALDKSKHEKRELTIEEFVVDFGGEANP